jgi:hypothetical protein
MIAADKVSDPCNEKTHRCVWLTRNKAVMLASSPSEDEVTVEACSESTVSRQISVTRPKYVRW